MPLAETVALLRPIGPQTTPQRPQRRTPAAANPLPVQGGERPG
jgi:hypothetical protein